VSSPPSDATEDLAKQVQSLTEEKQKQQGIMKKALEQIKVRFGKVTGQVVVLGWSTHIRCFVMHSSLC